MKVYQNEFSALKGHIADGCIIIAPSGKEFTLKNELKGWMIYYNNSQISGYLQSAFDVEYFVVNGLYSH